MPNPLVYKGGGVLQVMTTAERNALANVVLAHMVTVPGTGSLTTVSGGSNVSIGTFTDTSFGGNIGDANVTIVTSTIDLYQDLSTPSGTDAPRPIVYNSSVAPLQLMSDSDLNQLADDILSYGVNNDGPNSYVIDSSAPVSGTWVSIGSLPEVYSGAIVNTKYLYQRIDTTFSTERPLRHVEQGVLQQFSDVEIQYLAKRVRQRILDTNVGKYLFQASTPSPGTWVNKGSVTDTRATDTPNTYTGSYTGDIAYTGADTTYTSDVTADYTGSTDTAYEGPAVAVYTGPSTDSGTYINEYYIGPTTPYTQTFFLGYGLSYIRDYFGSLTYYSGPQDTYQGPTFYVTFYTIGYVSDVYQNDTVPVNFYTGYYVVLYYDSAYIDDTSGPSYTGNTYLGISPLYYNIAYYTGVEPELVYDSGAYIGPVGINYTGPTTFYTLSSYTGTGAAIYTGSLEYTGPATFTGQQVFDINYSGSIITDTPVNVSTTILWRRIA